MSDSNFNSTCMAISVGREVQLDSFRCFLAGFAKALNVINLGYICLALLLIISLISIFGGIKENYRWHVLNQAVWDIILSYRFICFNWIGYLQTLESTCFYDIKTGIFKAMFDNSIDTNSYCALLLLSFMRFLALYYPNFYRKLTVKRRMLYIIVIFNFIIIITTMNTVFDKLQKQRKDFLKQQCLLDSKTTNISSCSVFDYDFQVSFFKVISLVLYGFTFAKPLISLCLSIISAGFIFYKVVQQIKLKKSLNQKDVSANIRVCAVISFQAFINLFILIIETLNKYPLFAGTVLQNKDIFQTYILPSWLFTEYGLTDYGVMQAIVQLRILAESVLVLLVMTGYRECVVRLYQILKKSLCNKNSTSAQTTTMISTVSEKHRPSNKKSMSTIHI